jgi:hypothetical protein
MAHDAGAREAALGECQAATVTTGCGVSSSGLAGARRADTHEHALRGRDQAGQADHMNPTPAGAVMWLSHCVRADAHTPTHALRLGAIDQAGQVDCVKLTPLGAGIKFGNCQTMAQIASCDHIDDDAFNDASMTHHGVV